jgi:hypothetical protein
MDQRPASKGGAVRRGSHDIKELESMFQRFPKLVLGPPGDRLGVCGSFALYPSLTDTQTCSGKRKT